MYPETAAVMCFTFHIDALVGYHAFYGAVNVERNGIALMNGRFHVVKTESSVWWPHNY